LGARVIRSRGDASNAVAKAAELARQRLGLSPTTVILEYLCGATNALDPYSAYLTPDQLGELYAQIEGNFVGLGIELQAADRDLSILRVIPGSPAEEAGIRAGDRIVSVDGRSTINLSTDQAATLLQGEAGSVARLTVITPSQPPRQVSVRRRRVEVPSIDAVQILDPNEGIGYCRLSGFQKTTGSDLEAALWRLHREGMKSLIIDVRGNPGGLLTAAVDAADKFIERGTIVSTRGRNAQEDCTYSAHSGGTWRVPLVVLIDQDSASAAEIFAGAIRDHRRGTVVGVRSYGKGSVQGIFPLSLSNSGVRLTTAKFYSPAGRAYSRVGVEPDIAVQMAAKPIDGQIARTARDDAMLGAALQAARKLRSQPYPAHQAAGSAVGQMPGSANRNR
jgi:carboxyl-terminal processing protease